MGGDGRRQGGGPPGGQGGEVRRPGGAGRGIPDFKENPNRVTMERENGEAIKFNAQEAADWMASRFQAVVDEHEKQKASGVTKGSVQYLSDIQERQERQAWSAGAKPVLPPKDDFMQQLQNGLQQLRGRTEETKS